jgi:hypothetical protein
MCHGHRYVGKCVCDTAWVDGWFCRPPLCVLFMCLCVCQWTSCSLLCLQLRVASGRAVAAVCTMDVKGMHVRSYLCVGDTCEHEIARGVLYSTLVIPLPGCPALLTVHCCAPQEFTLPTSHAIKLDWPPPYLQNGTEVWLNRFLSVSTLRANGKHPYLCRSWYQQHITNTLSHTYTAQPACSGANIPCLFKKGSSLSCVQTADAKSAVQMEDAIN